MLVSGCAAPVPEANAEPTAYVTSTVDAAVAGESVHLSGYGRDEDGSVVGYLWRSELDGELSRSATFEVTSLSVGHHVIYFSVQDNNGDWSEPVRVSLTVSSAPQIVPRINVFSAAPGSIRAGQSVALSWDVSDATAVAIDQDIGVVGANGSLVVTPQSTTTYILSAVNGESISSALVTVNVEPVQVLVLRATPDMSGYVRFSGYAPYGDVYVGDDQADRGIRGFLTYYIHEIPRNSRITRVIVDMSTYILPEDDPFTGLGCLSAFEHQYNTLQGQYRMPGSAQALHQWCGSEELDLPLESAGIRDALQARLGEDRLQLRLQFADRETDVDQVRDLISWRAGTLPALTVEYYTAAG